VVHPLPRSASLNDAARKCVPFFPSPRVFSVLPEGLLSRKSKITPQIGGAG
jgi:hypothetical protein